MCVCVHMHVCLYVCYIYTTKYYSTLRKKEILLFVTAWMELEGIMLSAISQTETDKHHIVLPIYGTKKSQTLSNKEKKSGCQGPGQVVGKKWEVDKMLKTFN